MKVIYKLIEEGSRKNGIVSMEKELPDLAASDILLEIEVCKTLDVHHEIIKELFLRSPQPHIPSSVEVAGVVKKVGGDVTTINNGDRVAGLLPITSDWSGCATYCVLGEFDVVRLPEEVDCLTAAGSLMNSLQAYTALQYQCHVSAGDVVLILDGATSWGRIAIQLATMWGAKVICTVSTMDDRSVLEQLKFPPAQVIVGSMSTLVNHVVEETGGLGVNIVMDNGVRLFTREDESTKNGDNMADCPTKHDLISLLAVGGHWVTSCPHFQLDPPNSDQMLLRSASISFLLPHTWMLCPSRHGKLQHILQHFFHKVASKELELVEAESVLFSSLTESPDDDIQLLPGTLVQMNKIL